MCIRDRYKDEKVIANTSKKKSKKDDGMLVVDLHADEVLETTAGMNSADIFVQSISQILRKRGWIL